MILVALGHVEQVRRSLVFVGHDERVLTVQRHLLVEAPGNVS